MCTSRERALEAQERMRPYILKAEEDAKKMYKALEVVPRKVYETIPPDSFQNKLKRIIYWMVE